MSHEDHTEANVWYMDCPDCHAAASTIVVGPEVCIPRKGDIITAGDEQTAARLRKPARGTTE